METPRTPPDADRVVDLVLGLQDEKEKRETLERIAADPSLEAALRRQALAAEHARMDGTPRLGAGGGARTFRGRVLQAIREPRPPMLVGFGLAVMLVVALLKTPTPTGVSAIPPLPTELEAMRLRSGETLPAALNDGLAAYGAGEVERAIELLRAAETDGVIDLVRRAYLGSALARAERWDEALTVLDDVVKHPLPDPWGHEAEWARAVALKETGRTEDARAALTALAGEPEELGERARAMLERLPAP